MRVTLRQKVFLGISLVVVGMTVSVMTIVNFSTTRAVEDKIQKDLRAAQQVFEEFQKVRFHQLLTNAKMMAETPYLKAVVTTPDLDHETVLDSALGMQQIVKSDLLMILDAKGKLLASVSEPELYGNDLSKDPAFKKVLRGDSFEGIWIQNQSIYQVVIIPFLLNNEVVGALLTGFTMDRQVIQGIEKMTNCQIALIGTYGLDLASSSALVNLWSKKLHSAQMNTGQIYTQKLGTEQFLLIKSQLGNNPNAQYLLARSLDRELLLYKRLQNLLLLTALIILLVTVLLGSFYAKKITDPVHALLKGIRRIARGDLNSKVSIRSLDEIQDLADEFNQRKTYSKALSKI